MKLFREASPLLDSLLASGLETGVVVKGKCQGLLFSDLACPQ